jgi:hypothetical protein
MPRNIGAVVGGAMAGLVDAAVDHDRRMAHQCGWPFGGGKAARRAIS